MTDTDQQVLAAEARHAQEEREKAETAAWLGEMSEAAQDFCIEASRFSRMTPAEWRKNGGHPPKGL